MWPIEYTQEIKDWFSLQEEENKMNLMVLVKHQFHGLKREEILGYRH